MSVEMVCERKDGICDLCGSDPHEDCPLIGLAPELAEWSERPLRAKPLVGDWEQCRKGSCHRHKACMYTPCLIGKHDNDECESCQ